MKVFFHFSLNEYANTYLIGPEDGGDAILIDPGHIDLELIERIESNRFTIAHVLLTHRHAAHTEGLGTLVKIYDPTVYAGSPSVYDHPVRAVQDRAIMDLSGITVEAIQIPGHTMDSFVYRIGNSLFTGDVLYAGRIGSTNGVMEKALLLKGIKNRLLTLDERFLIFPGHGTISALKIEKLFNRELIDAMAIDDLEQLSHPSILT
ncbi:MAG: MBL fold metallo-hydrolase [Sphaerochaetaceae bacterium]|nr:MBL fold metallo-hydrolase [Sphaerochaetaceae bacterium]MDX9938922.1 MBL fold metallo-hydrolase [Sphaerochaetaceae bacterium]